MWRKLVRRYCPIAEFGPPAKPDDIAACERALGVAFPEELRRLLDECDGIVGEHELGLIWSTARIVEENHTLRTYPAFAELYMPFTHLLFFGDAGNGDLFAIRILSGAVRDTEVFCWDHENDSRSWVAPSVAKYVEWCLTGKIAVLHTQARRAVAFG